MDDTVRDRAQHGAEADGGRVLQGDQAHDESSLVDGIRYLARAREGAKQDGVCMLQDRETDAQCQAGGSL